MRKVKADDKADEAFDDFKAKEAKRNAKSKRYEVYQCI